VRLIRVNVSEPVYQDLKTFAKKTDRKTAALIGEALEIYRQMHLERRTSLRDRHPASVGGLIAALAGEDDLLEEMLDDLRD
jgi:hypothetical protein